MTEYEAMQAYYHYCLLYYGSLAVILLIGAGLLTALIIKLSKANYEPSIQDWKELQNQIAKHDADSYLEEPK